MNDVKLRQAIAYAIDVEQVTDASTKVYVLVQHSLIPPAFASFHDNTLTGFNYDPEKAKALLEEAGL